MSLITLLITATYNHPICPLIIMSKSDRYYIQSRYIQEISKAIPATVTASLQCTVYQYKTLRRKSITVSLRYQNTITLSINPSIITGSFPCATINNCDFCEHYFYEFCLDIDHFIISCCKRLVYC